jgi:hypothetical protein
LIQLLENRIVGRVTNTISTVDSAVRTVLIAAVLGVVSIFGYFAYDRFSGNDRALASAREELAAFRSKLVEAEEEIGGLRADIAKKDQQISRMELAMKLLKTDQRLARLDVLSQGLDEESGRVKTKLSFTELSPGGDAIGKPRIFEIDGEVVYLDNWVVKFEDKYVEQADLVRGTSLALFRRVFGEFQSPSEGFLIDEVGAMPQAYSRGGQPSEFEQEIWSDFWTFANDTQAAKEKGIRAAHGEALSMKVEEGRSYKVVLRSSDGLSIVPEQSKE